MNTVINEWLRVFRQQIKLRIRFYFLKTKLKSMKKQILPLVTLLFVAMGGWAQDPALTGYGVVKSNSLNYADGGWAGWSVPAGKIITAGGFTLTGGSATVSAPATPNSVWPHYTFGSSEYGWVVRDAPNGASSPGSNIYSVYADMPAGYEVITSHTMSFSDGGYAGWSVPAGKVVLGGGFYATGPVSVSAPGIPGSVWPHYTFGANEYGWVVRDYPDGASNSIKIYVICADKPAGYEIITSSTLNFSGTGWGGWSVPSGKFVVGGGFKSASPVRASAPGTPNSVWPHHTFGANEYGWVMQSNGGGATTVYAIAAGGLVHNVTQNTWYSQIQPAIDAANANDVIEAAAGTYNESVTVNKSLTIKGAQAGVNACGRSGAESIIKGFVDVTSAAANVTIDGFKLEKASSGNWAGNNLRFRSATFSLLNSKVVPSLPNGGFGFGAYVGGFNSAFSNVTILQNEFQPLTNLSNAWALTVQGAVSGTENISNNCFTNSGDAKGSSIVVYSTNTNPINTLTINNNTINNDVVGGSGGIGIGGSGVGTLNVKNNSITNSRREGLGLFTSVVTGGSVENNFITGSGVFATSSNVFVDAVSTWNPGFIVTNNDLSSPAGTGKSITNNASATLNANCNWYGTVILAAVAATVQGPVTYQLVLNSGTDTDPANGFQPASGTCQNICPLITVAMTGLTASCNGSATATPSGGTAPYTYLWSNGSTSQTITNVPAGTYTVTVTDANNCTGTGSRTITGSSPINPTTTQVNVSCFGGNDGSITVTGASVSALTPFTYNLNGSPFQNSNVFSNLAAGVYIVGLKDANGCSDFVTRTITQPALLTVTTSSIEKACFGQNNGAINITVSGGTGTKTYSWTSSPSGYTSSVRNPSNLSAGNYSVLVTDANGCTAELNNVTVASFDEIIVSSSITNVLCRGAFTGAIDLTVSGGTGSGFTYNWTGAVASTNEDLSNLGASTNYRVRITDAGSGCFVDRIFTVTQPNLLSVNTAFTNVTGCNSLGSITATGTGGTSPYEYNINGGAYQLSNVFTGLSAGSYTIGIRDANGCTASSTLRTISDFINDAYEPNNSSSASKPITIGTAINARISVATDADWFVITTPAGGGPISYSLVVTHPTLGYTFDMYPASPNNAAALTPTSVIGTTQKDYLLAPGTSYRIRVTNSSVSSVCYQLIVNQTIIPPAAEITQAGAATNQSKFQVAVVDDLNVKAFPNPHRGRFSLQIVSPVSGDARIELFNINGQKLQEKNLGVLQSAKNIVTFQLSNNGAVFYKVQIGKYYSIGKILGVE